MAIAVLLLAAASCASPGTERAASDFYCLRFPQAQERLLADLARDPDNRALYLNELGVVAMCTGDIEAARTRFAEARQIMGSFAETDLREVGAIVGAESSKIWLGESHEQAMNSWYLGMSNLLLGIDDNALAGFKNAIFVDSGQGSEQYDCDFAPAYFLEGLAWSRLGDAGMARRSLERAAELAPGCTALDPGSDGNLVVVVEVGRGPTKSAVGAHGERIRYVAHPETPTSIEIRVDGIAVGQPASAGDLHFQATTRGGRVFDAVLAGKAAYKTASRGAGVTTLILADDLPERHRTGAVIAGAALLLSSFTMDARADTRHWTTLPSSVQLFRTRVPPGPHQVEVVPSGGWRVTEPATGSIEVPETGFALVHRRVLR